MRDLISAVQLPMVLWGQRDMFKKTNKMRVENTLRHGVESEEIAPIQLMWETPSSSPSSSVKDTRIHPSAFTHTSDQCSFRKGLEEKRTQGLRQQKTLNRV